MLKSIKEILRRNKDFFYLIHNFCTKLPFYKKIFYWLHFSKAKILLARTEAVMIVYTPAHVGSSSIFKSLKNHSPSLPYLLFNIHTLRERWNNTSIYPSLSARHVVQEVFKKYSIDIIKKKVKLISAVMDPVNRALGGFFQSFSIFNPDKDLDNIQANEKEYHYLYENIMGPEFEKSYLFDTIKFQTTWFERDVKPFFGLDIEIDLVKKTDGFHIYEKDNVTLLVLKTERLSLDFEDAIEELIGERVKLINANRHQDRKKSNKEFYNYFKSNFKLPVQIISFIYDTPFIKKFYSEDEIKIFKKRWTVN